MSLLPRAPRFMFRLDAIQIQRPAANAGKTAVTYTQIYDGRGTLGTPTPTEFVYGPEAERSVEVLQPLALESGIDIRLDDRVITPRGTFTAVSLVQHRLHQRALLRKVV